MAKTKFSAILCAIITCLSFSSCCTSKKDGFSKRFFLFTCNFTDNECNLEFIAKKTFRLNFPKKSARIDVLKSNDKDSEKIMIKLFVDGKEMDRRVASWKDGSIQTYSAYGGLTTRVNILSDGQGRPYLEITPDWEAEPSMKDLTYVTDGRDYW